MELTSDTAQLQSITAESAEAKAKPTRPPPPVHKKMTSGKTQPQNTPQDLVERAVRQKYGADMIENEDAITAFWDDIRIAQKTSEEPVETERTIIDINTKEFVNHGTGQDESMVAISKGQSKEKSYNWISESSEGVKLTGNAKIAASIAGIEGGLGGSVERQTTDKSSEGESEKKAFSSTYAVNEKIVVPPRTKVNAVITTYTVRHEQVYTIEFAFPASSVVRIRYRSRRQRCCPGRCSSSGFVTASDILRNLPGYREEDGWVYFKEVGKLSWSGEGSKVVKTEEKLTD